MRNKKVECPKEKWLVVDYSPLDDKPEYRQPILCQAKDIGKIVYGMWIIGDKQYGKFQDDSRSDDEEKFYTAYKLVKEMFIHSNFELDKSDAPFIIKIGNPSAGTITEPAWEYFVAPFIDDYRPRYNPETDALDNGMIFIKMPSGERRAAKQTDGAAEKKSTDRPQLQDGDIVRVKLSDNGKTRCFPVWRDSMNMVYVDCGGDIFTYEQIVAIYRFDGRDFKCIWESREYKRLKLNEVLARAAAGAEHMEENVKSIIAALEQIGRYAKEAGDDKHGSGKAD